jgi:hypothetical protein
LKEENTICTSDFRIEKNIIAFNDTMLQISNISHISVEPIPPSDFNLWSIVVLIVGVLGLFQTFQVFRILGGFFVLMGGIYLIWYAFINSNSKERYLYIYMCSGNTFTICCENTKFLKKVMKVIEYCINNQHSTNIKIDFDNCKLYNSPVTLGDKNEVLR